MTNMYFYTNSFSKFTKLPIDDTNDLSKQLSNRLFKELDRLSIIKSK